MTEGEFLGVARKAHRKIRWKLGAVSFSAADFDDFKQVATLGMLEALPRLAEGNPHAFLTTRALGAVQDELRRLDPVSRADRRKARAYELLPHEERTDLAHERRVEARSVPFHEMDWLQSSARTPECILDARKNLETALSTLEPREREIIVRSLLVRETMGEIGASLGITEARVSQIRTWALRKLRANASLADVRACSR